MKRQVLSVIALVIMVVLAFGSSDTPSTDRGSSPSQASSQTSPSVATENSTDAETPGTSSNQRRAEAMVMGEDFVKKFLKYPLDAKFPMFGTSASGNDSTGYWVTGTVKAKNAFGAELTHEWKVNLTVQGDNWHLVYCEIGGEPQYVDQETAEALAGLQAAMNSQETETPKEGVQGAERQKRNAPRRSVPERHEYEFRTWTDSTGTYTIEAKFVSYGSGNVTIEKKDGSKTTLSLDRLSEEDQKWVKALLR